jgi:hypothetical protein
MFELAAVLVVLHGPGGHDILINPSTVTSMTGPRSGKNISDDVKCLINTTDGKFISVIETCDVVRDLIRQSEHPQ